ncbi:GNAT family N-acetyltransferase [Alteribacillus bidgolensis]|uniref:Acetyltransferase (GNAT) domain-containing protein n=1 Tax=Alteribacillus bidgolensis TaxID=930129 RepID=A0A1G8QDC1_9BACI|nr:GNAT family N-acetyltransferase [Alteribacillus bidgolensis]SDJ02789.1 Acetyltransferase (GNAT) domain-containing protein [Alteribacillus bidgolensis]
MRQEIIRETPWDKPALKLDTYELLEYSEEALQKSDHLKGHFTIKVDPLESKQLLHTYGFYYTDTLLTPVCKKERFTPFVDKKLTLLSDVKREEIIAISKGAYDHGRFHRDFKLEKSGADQRYDNWLNQLYDEGNVWGLLYEDELAGFFAFSENQVLLQAFKPEYQGRGLAKYFWSRAVRSLFEEGHVEIKTSISAANLAMVNLTASLGFKFADAVDVYHKLNQ